MLFNEPKLLKCCDAQRITRAPPGFSALQRAEIAEIDLAQPRATGENGVSVLFNEPKLLKFSKRNSSISPVSVSVLFNEPKLLKFQKSLEWYETNAVSVLFNEPKLLKWKTVFLMLFAVARFSALQRAEIAEIQRECAFRSAAVRFQCSSTSRNC